MKEAILNELQSDAMDAIFEDMKKIVEDKIEKDSRLKGLTKKNLSFSIYLKGVSEKLKELPKEKRLDLTIIACKILTLVNEES